MKNNNFPEKWFIIGSPEFGRYCDDKKANIAGTYTKYWYLNNLDIEDPKFWRDWRHIEYDFNTTGYTELSFDEFKILIEGGSLDIPNTEDDYEPLIRLLKEI